MNTILTITLNPTVDKSSTVENIKPEKKLRCTKPVYEPGGGGINVSRGLVRLGINTIALFTSGGRTGILLEQLLEKENVKIMPVKVEGETRENFIVVDTANNEQYRFGKQNNARLIADTSGEALNEILKEGIYLFKPNIGELSRLTGIETLDNDSAHKTAEELIENGKAEIIVISMGPQGAYLVTKDGGTHIPAPSVKKLSTVGAGDSMVAGMVSILAKGGTAVEMACMGVACGTAATMNPGTGLFKKEDAEKLYNWLIAKASPLK